MAIENKTWTQEDLGKLREIVQSGVRTLQEMDDLKEGLSDAVKTVAATLDIPPKILSQAIRIAHKDNLADKKEDMSDIEELLALSKK